MLRFRVIHNQHREVGLAAGGGGWGESRGRGREGEGGGLVGVGPDCA